MIFALAGNQNCGKTTLFNQLTGSNQHVGNFPGVTVDQKIGEIRGQKDCSVVDLPGIYSIRPYTSEEIVTRDFILNEKPDGIINIVDATNIERNLYLTLQLIEMNIPMVLALNMMDEMRNNGGTVDISRMSEELGIPVVPISAIKNEGIEELLQTALHVARDRQYPQIYDFCPSGPVHRCIHSVCHQIEDHAEKAGISVRFAATKLIEGDASIAEKLSLDQNELELIEHSIIQMEEEHGMDRNAALADMRYDFIEKVCAATVIKPQESKEHLRSVKIDSVLTNKYLAIPIFILVMFLVFFLTFNVFGAFLSDLLAAGIDWVTAVVDKALTAYGINPVVHSLLIDGVFAGVGSAVFLPFYSGGYRLYGADCLCDGQAAAKNRSFRQKHCAASGWLWLYRSCRYGNAYPFLGQRQTHDDSAYAVYELLRKDSHLCGLCSGIFPAACGAGDDWLVCRRDAGGDCDGTFDWQNRFQRESCSLRYGTAELSLPFRKKRVPSHVG